MPPTLADIRLRAQRRADFENSEYISDDEWRDLVNEAGSELHDILVSKFGDDYYLSSVTISITSDTDEYDLPADFLKVRGVDYISGTNQYTIPKFQFEERNRFQFWGTVQNSGPPSLFYRVVGNKIRFIPTPNTQATITLWYIPQYARLVSDSDEIDGVLARGWEDYIVLRAAHKAAIKSEDESVADLERELQFMKMRIEEASSNRDVGLPERIVDVDSFNYRDIDDLYMWGNS